MTAFHVMAGDRGGLVRPAIRRISASDVFEALAMGFSDFQRKPSHYVFLCLIYPIAGGILISWSAGQNLLPLIFPLVSGFALLGPLVSLGLYDMSRRLEGGGDPNWRLALEVRHSPAVLSIVAMAAYLFAVFLIWLLVANGLYDAHFGADPHLTTQAFLHNVLQTDAGWKMMAIGDVIGFWFAVLVLATSVVAFPLLLERDVGAVAAIGTSVRATLKNPVPVLLWGVIVAAMLVIGIIPLLAGLAITMPVLGHATWHLYRKMIEVPNS
jgi:uncharacterized membrane protein